MCIYTLAFDDCLNNILSEADVIIYRTPVSGVEPGVPGRIQWS